MPNTLDTLTTRVCDGQNYLLTPDCVCPILLKEGAQKLSTYLCRLFNASLQTGHFPSIGKRANIILLHKKNDKSCIANYRPLSLLISVGKAMERLVFKLLFQYFLDNFLISVWQ